MIDLTKISLIQRPEQDGPFTDEMVRSYVMAAKTQDGIQKYAEAMAQVLAEAGRASQKAIGDRPEYAIDRWCDVIRQRAKQLLREQPKQLEPPTLDANS